MTSSAPSSRRLFEHELQERLDAALFASPSHRSVDHLAASLEPLTRQQQEKVLHWAAVAAKTQAEIGYLLATLAAQAFRLFDDEAFDAWVIACLDGYDRQGLRVAMEQLRDIDGFLARREGRVAARLADSEARLTRLLRGLSGRPLTLGVAPVPWTDTQTIFLPEVLAEQPTAAANRRLYKATAVLLWAQSRYGTFKVDIDAAIAALPDRQHALAWLAVLEAVRLEACLARDLPGLAREVAAVRDAWPDVVAARLARLSQAEASVVDSIDLLPELLAGGAPPRLAVAGALDPTAARRVRDKRIAEDVRVLRNALAALKGIGGGKQGGEAVLDIVPGDTAAVRIDGEVVALPVDAQAAARSLVQDLGEVPPEALRPAGPGAWSPTDRRGEGPERELPDDRAADWRYDEWDCHRAAYRKAWCHVFETEVAPGDTAYVEDVRRRQGALIRQIRRRFEAIRGEDRVLGRQPDGEEIDLDAQVDLHIDRRSGVEPSSRLFCRRIRNERSMAAMFMVDMSGSTKGWVNDAEREALILLCEAIETLGDDYAIYGFSGWTRTRCDIYRIKAFGEHYGDAVRQRIAGIEAKDYTRMGFAIRHLSGLLSARPVRHKLLVTLSDGRPDDFGDEYRGTYGIEDTRQALLEARRQGVHSYCVTIDRHGADYLKRMYGAAAYTVIDEVGKLPARLVEIYRRLTAN